MPGPGGLTGTAPVRDTTPNGSSNGADFTIFGVNSISPNKVVQNTTSFSAAVQGSGFKAGATVRLKRGNLNIDSASTNVAPGSVIDCVFSSFAGAETVLATL